MDDIFNLDKLSTLHKAVSADYDIGDFETFKTKMSDPDKVRAFYDGVGDAYALGSFDDFKSKIYMPNGSGEKAKASVIPVENIIKAEEVKKKEDVDKTKNFPEWVVSLSPDELENEIISTQEAITMETSRLGSSDPKYVFSGRKSDSFDSINTYKENLEVLKAKRYRDQKKEVPAEGVYNISELSVGQMDAKIEENNTKINDLSEILNYTGKATLLYGGGSAKSQSESAKINAESNRLKRENRILETEKTMAPERPKYDEIATDILDKVNEKVSESQKEFKTRLAEDLRNNYTDSEIINRKSTVDDDIRKNVLGSKTIFEPNYSVEARKIIKESYPDMDNKWVDYVAYKVERDAARAENQTKIDNNLKKAGIESPEKLSNDLMTALDGITDNFKSVADSMNLKFEREMDVMTSAYKKERDGIYDNWKQALNELDKVEPKTPEEKLELINQKEELKTQSRDESTAAYAKYIDTYNTSLKNTARTEFAEMEAQYEKDVNDAQKKYKMTVSEDGKVEFDKDYEEKYNAVIKDAADLDYIENVNKWSKLNYGEKFMYSMESGTMNMWAGLGGGLKWAGFNELGNSLTELREGTEFKDIPRKEFEWQDLSTPEWWVTNAGEQLPFLMSLAAPALGVSSVVANVTAKAAIPALGKFLIAGATGAVISRPLESVMESGLKYLEDIESGLSIESASKNAGYVFKKNMALIGLDALQFGAVFTKLGSSIAGNTVKALSQAPVEGWEELYQEYHTLDAGGTSPYESIGQFFKEDPNARHAFAAGAATGLVFSVTDIMGVSVDNERIQRKTLTEMLMHNNGDITARREQIANTAKLNLTRKIITPEEFVEFEAMLNDVASTIENAPAGISERRANQLVDAVAEVNALQKKIDAPGNEAMKDAWNAQQKVLKQEVTDIITGEAKGYFIDNVSLTKDEFNEVINSKGFLTNMLNGNTNIQVYNDEATEKKANNTMMAILEARRGTTITDSVLEELTLTEDGKGVEVYVYEDEEVPTIKSTATESDVVWSRPKWKGYTDKSQKTKADKKVENTVVIPVGKLYDVDDDPLGLFDASRKEFKGSPVPIGGAISVKSNVVSQTDIGGITESIDNANERLKEEGINAQVAYSVGERGRGVYVNGVINGTVDSESIEKVTSIVTEETNGRIKINTKPSKASDKKTWTGGWNPYEIAARKAEMMGYDGFIKDMEGGKESNKAVVVWKDYKTQMAKPPVEPTPTKKEEPATTKKEEVAPTKKEEPAPVVERKVVPEDVKTKRRQALFDTMSSSEKDVITNWATEGGIYDLNIYDERLAKMAVKNPEGEKLLKGYDEEDIILQKFTVKKKTEEKPVTPKKTSPKKVTEKKTPNQEAADEMVQTSIADLDSAEMALEDSQEELQSLKNDKKNLKTTEEYKKADKDGKFEMREEADEYIEDAKITIQEAKYDVRDAKKELAKAKKIQDKVSVEKPVISAKEEDPKHGIAREAGLTFIGTQEGMPEEGIPNMDMYNVDIAGQQATFTVPEGSNLEAVIKKRDAKVKEFGGAEAKTGQQNADFFTEKATTASSEIAYKPVLKVNMFTKVAKAYKKFTQDGNFTGHISKMIAGFAEKQMKVGEAIVKNKKLKSFLDVGASEGGLMKAVAASRPDMTVVGIDPNPKMRENYNETPDVKNAEFRLEALGASWTEADGTKINEFKPKQKFDVINEDYVFQFISSDRKTQVGQIKALLNDDGIFVTSEKFHTENFEANEKKKYDHQRKYFKPEELTKDKEEIVTGMSDDMVNDIEYMKLLKENFTYVEEFWNAGNFKGYVASNNKANVDAFLNDVGDLTSEFTDPKATKPADVAVVKGNAPTTQVEVRKLTSSYAGFGVITARKETDSSPEVTAANNAKLRAELVEKYGEDRVLDVQGYWKGKPEGLSFFVTGMSHDDAMYYGVEYGQEAVLTKQGFMYMDGTWEVASDVVTTGAAAKTKDGYTEFDNGQVFSSNIQSVRSAESNGTTVVTSRNSDVIQNIIDKNLEAGNEISKKLAKDLSIAVRVVKSLSGINKGGVTVHFNINEDTFSKSLAGFGGRTSNPKAFVAQYPQIFSNGKLVSASEIYISPRVLMDANENSVWHEAVHPILAASIKSNPDIVDSLYNALSEFKEFEKYIDFGLSPSYIRDKVSKVESVTEFMADFAGNSESIPKSMYDAFIQWVKDFLRTIGINTSSEVIVDPNAEPMSFINTVTFALQEGRVMRMKGDSESGSITGNPTVMPGNTKSTGRSIDFRIEEKPVSIKTFTETIDKSTVRRGTIDEYNGKSVFAMAMDRMLVGEVESTTGGKVNGMGGLFYPVIGKTGGWAFSDLRMAQTVLNNIKNSDGIAFLMAMSTESQSSNDSFTYYMMTEFNAAIKDGRTTVKDVAKAAKHTLGLNTVLNFHPDIKKVKKGKKTIIVKSSIPVAKAANNKVNSFNELEDLLLRGSFMFRRTFYTMLLNKTFNNQTGIPTIRMALDITKELALDNAQHGDLIGVIKFSSTEVIDTRKSDKYVTHPSYPFIIPGKLDMVFNESYDSRDVFPVFTTGNGRVHDVKNDPKHKAANNIAMSMPIGTINSDITDLINERADVMPTISYQESKDDFSGALNESESIADNRAATTEDEAMTDFERGYQDALERKLKPIRSLERIKRDKLRKFKTQVQDKYHEIFMLTQKEAADEALMDYMAMSGKNFDELTMSDVSKIKNKIRTNIGQFISDEANPYLKVELLKGKAKYKIDNMEANIVGSNPESMKSRMAVDGVELEKFGMYLYAKHAVERNETVNEMRAKSDKDRLNAPSGMSNEQAAEILAEFEKDGLTELYEGYAEEFQFKVIDNIQQEAISSGLINKRTKEKWRSTYKNYVPLKAKASGFSGVEGSKKLSITGNKFYRSKGSDILTFTDRTNPFIRALLDYNSVVVRGEKNRALLSLVENMKQYRTNEIKLDKQGSREAYDSFGEVEGLEKIKVDERKSIGVMIDGQQYMIRFKDEELARAFTGLGVSTSSGLINVLSKVNSYLRGVYTIYNPSFLFTNFLRDVQAAGIAISRNEIKGLEAKMMKNIPAAARGIWREGQGKPGVWSDLMDELKSYGGTISWLQIYDVDEFAQNISKKFEKLKDEKDSKRLYKELLGNAKGLMDRMGAVAEMSSRLAAYKAAIDSGISKERAAQLAKNLTVNFEKKGEWGTILNSIYLFSNAGIQGTAIVFKTLKSRRGQMFAASLMAISAAMRMLNDMVDGDGDEYEKIPDTLKNRNLIFMLGEDSGYLRIPLPYGFNIFKVMGEIPHDVAKQIAGGGSAGKAFWKGAKRLLISAESAFNPVSSGTLGQLLSPTVLDPFIQIAENKTWFGTPMVPEQPFYEPKVRDSSRYFSNTRPASIAVANLLNRITGGTDVESGFVDISPAWIDVMINNFGGGTFKFIEDVAHVPPDVAKAMNGMNEDGYSVDDLPIIGTFYDTKSEYRDRRRINYMISESKREKFDDYEVKQFNKAIDNAVAEEAMTEDYAKSYKGKFEKNQRYLDYVREHPELSEQEAIEEFKMKESKKKAPSTGKLKKSGSLQKSNKLKKNN